MPCLYAESVFNTAVALQCMLHGTSWPWKFVFMHSFYVFNLPLTYLPSLFIGSVDIFSNNWLNLIPNLFILSLPRHLLRDIKWHCIGRVFIVLQHPITKNIFRCLDKEWYQRLISLITYNIMIVFSIIAWHYIRPPPCLHQS